MVGVVGVVEVAADASAAPANEPATTSPAATLFRRRDTDVSFLVDPPSEPQEPDPGLSVCRESGSCVMTYS